MTEDSSESRRPRETRQRRAIRRSLEKSGNPLSPDELFELARRQVRGLGIATVYRNLKSLQDDGSIVPVELPGEGVTRYELSGKDHHHHFLCRECERVYDVGGCPPEVDAGTPDGFQVEHHEIVLYGVCEACA